MRRRPEKAISAPIVPGYSAESRPGIGGAWVQRRNDERNADQSLAADFPLNMALGAESS